MICAWFRAGLIKPVDRARGLAVRLPAGLGGPHAVGADAGGRRDGQDPPDADPAADVDALARPAAGAVGDLGRTAAARAA